MSQDAHEIDDGPVIEPQRIDTWKNIAAFFPCDESTARRWEKSYGMPVHRVKTDKVSGVYAFSDELQAWADEHLEMSPEGEVGARGEVAEASVVEQATEEPTQRPSELRSKSGRLKVLAFALIVVAALGYFLLKRHSHSTSGNAEPVQQMQHPQVEISPPATLAKSPDTTTPTSLKAGELDQQAGSSLRENSAEGIHQALRSFTDASHVNPDDAQAFVGIAECENALAFLGDSRPAELFAKAYEAANRAVMLKPDSAKAHHALAMAELYGKWDGKTSIAEFKRAVELDSKSAVVRKDYADGMFALGDTDGALKVISDAKRIDTSSVDIQASRAFLMANSAHPEEGTNALRSLVQAHPEALQPKRLLVDVLLDQQHVPEAMPLLDDIVKLSGETRDTVVAEAVHEGWDHGRTVGAFISLLKTDQHEYLRNKSVGPQMALIALRLKRKDEALEYLRTALDEKYPQALMLANSVFARELANDVDFIELRKNLPSNGEAISDKD